MHSAGNHGPSSSDILQHATAALNLGQVERARELAHSVYNLSATEYPQEATQAHALLCLAHCDLMVSRFRRSQETAQRAATVFQAIADHDGEAQALTVLARAAAFLGRNEEAVEAAMLAVQLAHGMPSGRTKARASHALGIAYYFSRSFEKAEAMLEDTVQIAREAHPALSPYQPRLDQAFAEAVRNVKASYLNEYLPKTRRMQSALELCALFAQSGDGDHQITQGEAVWGKAAWHLLQGL
jgi:tetratricopeptide (TPR) repeat protein